MSEDFLAFFSRRNIDIFVDLRSEQSSPPFPLYDVTMRKGDREAVFAVMGDPESGRRMTPEDACRALHIRIRLHEDRVSVLPQADSLCRDTVARLKDILGPAYYCEFIDLGRERQARASHAPERRIPGLRGRQPVRDAGLRQGYDGKELYGFRL